MKFETTINLEDLDVEVVGTIEQGCPATWGYHGGSPAEPTTFVIEKVIARRGKFRVDITNLLSSIQIDDLEQRALEELDDRAYAAQLDAAESRREMLIEEGRM